MKKANIDYIPTNIHPGDELVYMPALKIVEVIATSETTNNICILLDKKLTWVSIDLLEAKNEKNKKTN